MPEIRTGRLDHAIPDAAMVADICKAMRHALAVSFIYDGKTRIVEAHAIGTSTKDGGVVLRGYQVAGDASRPLPQWTLFRVEQITGLGLTFTDSLAPREGYREGDKQMARIIAELKLP